MSKYQLVCLLSNDSFKDKYTLHYNDSALIRPVYNLPLSIKENEIGVWKYIDWLPVSESSKHTAGTVTYKSKG